MHVQPFVLTPKHSTGQNIHSLHAANGEIQSVLAQGTNLFLGIKKRRDEAQGELFSLATIIFGIICVILHLIPFVNLDSPVQRMMLQRSLPCLPAKETGLQHARQAVEAEDKIMKVEQWAIDRLNEHQRKTLRALHRLQAAVINADGEEPVGEAGLSQRTVACALKIELVKELERITAKTIRSHQRYNRAEMEKKMIEDGRAEVANLPPLDFWIGSARRIKDAQPQVEKAWPGWLWPCVIL